MSQSKGPNETTALMPRPTFATRHSSYVTACRTIAYFKRLCRSVEYGFFAWRRGEFCERHFSRGESVSVDRVIFCQHKLARTGDVARFHSRLRLFEALRR